MFIKNGKFSNFRAIKKADLNFQKGINIISGENGQGKSHIFQGLAFPIINYSIGVQSDYLNWDAEEYEVATELEHLGKLFKINLKYSGGTLNRELWIDNEHYIGSAATKVLADHFDPMLCKAAMISMQGELDLISSEPAEKRNRLKKIYNLDYSKNIKDIEKELKSLKTETLQPLKDKLLLLENATFEPQELKEYPYGKGEYEQKLKLLSSLQAKFSSIETAINEYEEKVKAKAEWVERLSNQENKRITIASSIVKETQNKESLENELKNDNVANEIQQLRNNYDQKDWEVPIRELQAEIDAIILKRIPLFDNDALVQKNLNYSSTLSDLRYKEEELARIKEGKCPTCGRPYDSNDQSVVEQEIATLAEMKDKLFGEIAILEQEKKTIDDQTKENNDNINKKTLLEERLKSTREAIEKEKQSFLKDIQNKEESHKQRVANLQSQIENSQKQINQFLVSQQELETEITDTKTQIANIVIPDQKPETDEIMSKQIEEIKTSTRAYESVQTENEIIERQNKELEQKKLDNVQAIESLKKEIADVQDSIDVREKAKTILQKDFPNYVIKDMGKKIEYGINNMVGEVYDGRYNVTLEEVGNGIDFFYGNRPQSISFGSGFEKSLFNMGYKNAFSRIANLGVLLLDEVDSYADEKNSPRLFEVIGNARNNYEQIFIITHKAPIKELLMRDYEAKLFVVENGVVHEG